MPVELLALPVFLEWLFLATVAAPLLLQNRDWVARHPAIALACWHLLFLSAGLAALGAFATAVWFGFESWLRVNTVEMGGSSWLEVVALSFVPWILLALSGIFLALATERVEPAVSASKLVNRALAIGLKQTTTFEGYSVMTLDVSVMQAFVMGRGANAKIVISAGALQTLNPMQLKAVLWHEVGHIKLKHNAILSISGFVAHLLPFVRTSQIFQAEVSRLVEVQADNYALARVSHSTLLETKLCFTSAG